MSLPSNKCPECGGEVSIDASGRVCAACALRLALSPEGNRSAESADPSGGGAPPGSPPRSGSSRGSQLPPGGYTRWLARPSGKWSLILLAVLATAYVAARMVWAQNYFRPQLYVEADLRPVLVFGDYGLDATHRLVEVNGSPIFNTDQFGDLIDAADRATSADLTFASDARPAERVLMTWIQVPYIPEFGVNAAGAFEPGPEGKFPVLALSPGEAVTAIQGVALSKIAADGIDPLSLRRWHTTVTAANPATPDLRHEFVVFTVLWHEYWGKFATGIAFVALGLLALWHRPQSKLARAFAIFSGYLGLWMYSRSLFLYHRLPFEMYVYLVLQVFLPVAGVLFVCTYTPMRAAIRRPLLWIGVAATFCLALAIVSGVVAPDFARHGLLSTRSFGFWAGAMLLLVIFSVFADLIARLFKVRMSPTDRERRRVIWLAILLGALPSGLYTFLVQSPSYYRFPVDMTVLIFPALILYAITRHNLLNMNELAREGLIYGLLLSLIMLGCSGALGLMAPLLDRVAASNAAGIQAALMAGVFLVAIPVYTRTRKALDSRFSRVPIEYETLMNSLESASGAETTPHEYCQRVVTHFREVTSAARICLLTNFDEYGGWSFAAMVPVVRTEQTVERCRPMLEVLMRERKTIFRQDLIEFAEEADGAAPTLDAMDTLDAEVVYPLIAYGKVVGALCVGEKTTRRNFSAPELKSMERATRYIAATLTNLMGRIVALEGRRIADIFPRFPSRIGGFDILGVLGEGGMAFVYHGNDGTRDVAIKVANRMVQSNPVPLERFQREAAVIQRLKSPHVVEVLEVGWQVSEPYIVLEYFGRGSLDVLLKARGRLPEAEALRIVCDVARGLDVAFKAGIIHRDIKPRNIFMTDDGRAKVGDFGLALISDRTPLTVAGELFGTPDYMAPELARGERATWQADQYALGITLFELLAGRKPYKGDKFEAILYQHIHEPLPIPKKLAEGLRLETIEIIRRMTEKSPAARFGSYTALIECVCQNS